MPPETFSPSPSHPLPDRYGEVMDAPEETGVPKAERSARHLAAMIEVSDAIGTLENETALCRRIGEVVSHVFEADRASLFVHDPGARALVSRVALGEKTPLRLPLDRGLVGEAFTQGRPSRVDDAAQDPRFDGRVAHRTGYRPRSLITVPVLRDGRPPVGVLQVMDRRPSHFDAQDLTLATAVARIVAVSLENARLHAARETQFESFVRALSTAIDARDPSTGEHSSHVANYAMGIGEMLGLERAEIEYLRIAGLLHDVGKIGTPERILTKPGELTDEERTEMDRHAAHSLKILSRIDFARPYTDLPEIAASHHEMLDGSGYPRGLTANALDRKARVLAVSDVFAALTEDRHYRKGRPVEEALDVLRAMTPDKLDAECVRALERFLGREP